MVPPRGRLAQWKSARLTRERSLVRPQRRPPTLPPTFRAEGRGDGAATGPPRLYGTRCGNNATREEAIREGSRTPTSPHLSHGRRWLHRRAPIEPARGRGERGLPAVA